MERTCRQSVENLGLDYIDLYLIHFPFGYMYKNDSEQWPRNPDGSRALRYITHFISNHKIPELIKHFPFQHNSNVDYVDTWKAMEKLVTLGLVKSIGISNFNSEQIKRLLTIATIKPVVNQVECSPMINQRKLTRFCKERDIIVMGFCPLGHPNAITKSPPHIFDERVKAIGDKYNKSPAQIVLRYLVNNQHFHDANHISH